MAEDEEQLDVEEHQQDPETPGSKEGGLVSGAHNVES